MSATVVSINVGRVVDTPGSLLGRTGIDKHPVAGRVRATTTGLEGDEVADAEHHGGIDQAVYVYAREDMDRWAAELGRELVGGAFGENLTTRGLDPGAALIGERWRIGEAEFEVSAPRTPCGTFQNHLKERAWVRRFGEAGYTGLYVRVLTEGTVGVGDEVELLHQPDHGLTVLEAFRAMTTEKHLSAKLLDVPELPKKYRDRAASYLAAQSR
jgi:MOSC domain-containing protein YiiM